MASSRGDGAPQKGRNPRAELPLEVSPESHEHALGHHVPRVDPRRFFVRETRLNFRSHVRRQVGSYIPW